MMLKINGNVGITRFMIRQQEPNGLFRVYIGGIYRASKATLKGAIGVVEKIGAIKGFHMWREDAA